LRNDRRAAWLPQRQGTAERSCVAAGDRWIYCHPMATMTTDSALQLAQKEWELLDKCVSDHASRLFNTVMAAVAGGVALVWYGIQKPEAGWTFALISSVGIQAVCLALLYLYCSYSTIKSARRIQARRINECFQGRHPIVWEEIWSDSWKKSRIPLLGAAAVLLLLATVQICRYSLTFLSLEWKPIYISLMVLFSVLEWVVAYFSVRKAAKLVEQDYPRLDTKDTTMP
jgi:hypothetical protein